MTGNFSRGEVIRIRNLEGRDIVHGRQPPQQRCSAPYCGSPLQQIDAILGYEYGPVAVHRDDMIIRYEPENAGTNVGAAAKAAFYKTGALFQPRENRVLEKSLIIWNRSRRKSSSPTNRIRWKRAAMV